MARASNRAQIDFCSIDDRLLPMCNVPLASLEQASVIANEAIELDAAALLIPWACPKNHATSHIELDRVWAQAEEAGIPILLHVGAADFVLPKAHANNGLPEIADFHGSDENFRSISYMAIPSAPQQALSMLILDGVLEAFSRHEERLQSLKLKPGEYVSRQVRVTPYPTEDAGWIISKAGENSCMFSSDYPHVEGGRNPSGRFQKSTAGLNESALDAFYRGNFESLMGTALSYTHLLPK